MEFRFSNDLLDYFYSFDKGVAHVHLDRGGSLLQCVIHQALHYYPLLGVEGIYQDRSEEVCGADARQGELLQILQAYLMSKSLQPALDYEKRLYDCGMVDQYYAIYRLFRGGCPRRAEQRCVGWPTYLVFTVDCREDEVQDDQYPQELPLSTYPARKSS